jgi:hypothetical protein
VASDAPLALRGPLPWRPSSSSSAASSGVWGLAPMKRKRRRATCSPLSFPLSLSPPLLPHTPSPLPPTQQPSLTSSPQNPKHRRLGPLPRQKEAPRTIPRALRARKEGEAQRAGEAHPRPGSRECMAEGSDYGEEG